MGEDDVLFKAWLDRLLLEVLRFSLEEIKKLPEDDPLARYLASFCLDYGIYSRKLERLAKRRVSGREFELVLAANLGGNEWRKDPEFHDLSCMRCNRSGLWYAVLESPHPKHPASWRYTRPENFVKLCRPCRAKFNGSLDRVAEWMWGKRFLALRAWHERFCEDPDLDWDKERYPLWPPELGGMSWEEGNPALLAMRAPSQARLPHLARRAQIEKMVFAAGG